MKFIAKYDVFVESFAFIISVWGVQFLNGFWMVSALPHLEVIKSVQILMFLLGWNTSSQKPSTKYKSQQHGVNKHQKVKSETVHALKNTSLLFPSTKSYRLRLFERENVLFFSLFAHINTHTRAIEHFTPGIPRMKFWTLRPRRAYRDAVGWISLASNFQHFR